MEILRKDLQSVLATTKFTERAPDTSAVLAIDRGHKTPLEISNKLGKGDRFKVLFPANEPPDNGPFRPIWKGRTLMSMSILRFRLKGQSENHKLTSHLFVLPIGCVMNTKKAT